MLEVILNPNKYHEYVKTQTASLRSGLSCLWESVTLSPGLNAGIPRYGQLPHLQMGDE